MIYKNNHTNTLVLESLKLPVFYDIHSLSDRLGLSTRIIYILSQPDNAQDYYTQFKIPKSDGTSRTIDSPTYSLKLVQKWILKEILEKIEVSEESMAFKPGIGNGTKKNAEQHKRSLYCLSVDVKDFFKSINSKQIFFLFKGVGYNNTISNILTNICTLEGALPQGGVCSPYLSNLVCRKLDKRLSGLCLKREIVYSRYADDLTFSTNDKVGLKKIYKIVVSIVEDEGFILNNKKTRFLSPSSHKVITGITINQNNLKANKAMKKKVRYMIHHSVVASNYSKNDIIRGYIAYISSIEKDYRKKVIKYINTLILKDYRHDAEIVKRFNENKLYKDINNMEYESVGDYNEGYEDIEGFRYDFLLERKLL